MNSSPGTGRAPFETVVTEHGATVLRVCRAVLGPHADADDAWAETFLAALRAWPELPVGANVQAWLVTIAHRKAIDVIRARGRHAVPADRLPERPSRHGNPDPARPDLWAALAALPEKQRLSVVHHHLGGLPYRDVAALVGGTEARARRAAADGVAALRRLLADPEADASARPSSARTRRAAR
ncbi:RNA polymerase sigma factor [Tersicoccus solisilvae]|uniref:RNA polymerase sigma factor n=1 Tax=Tersicoccus solisilvae TaxID=1882339 RepID=UPI0016638420|nr:sigma-70 family RNA polymerase sigma factor [Tersicoccus solisilvae]